MDDSPLADSDPAGLVPKLVGATRRRPCNDEETRKCKETCGWKGVETCFVIQTFRIRGTRTNQGGTGAMTEYEWRDGPPTCSCNDCEKTLKRFWDFLTGPNPYANFDSFSNRNPRGGPFPFPVAPLPVP